MDFLKKKMKELLDDDDKKDKPSDKPADTHGAPDHAPTGDRGQSDGYYGGGAPPPPQHPSGYPPQGDQQYQQQGYGQPPQQQWGPPQGQYGAPAPQQYGGPPQQYGGPPPGQYGAPQNQYGGPPTPQGPPAPYGAPPPMPPGWVAQWDQNGQRWYYVEQATGRTQWDPPSNLPPGPYAPPAPGAPYNAAAGHDERGLFGNTHGHSGHDYNTAPGSAAVEKEKKDKGHSTAMLAAAGIGGIAAGAFIGHQLADDSSDDEDKKQAAAAVAPPAAYPPADPAYAAAPIADPYGTDPYGDHAFQEPPPVPTHDEDGSSISSSDRESLEERREELIEAQEEYQEELQEAYEDD